MGETNNKLYCISIDICTDLLSEADTAKHSSAQPPLLVHAPPGNCLWGENTRSTLTPSKPVLTTLTLVPLYLSVFHNDWSDQFTQYTYRSNKVIAPFETNNGELLRASKLPVFKFLSQFNSTMKTKRMEDK